LSTMLRRSLTPLLRRATTSRPPLSMRRIGYADRYNSFSSMRPKPVPEGSAYAVLGVSREIDEASLRATYKQLAREWHPDRHQEGREQAEQRFQEISEAFQILSDEVKRRAYDTELDAARTVEETKKAAQRFRATSWNSKVPDVAERLKNAKREEPGFPPHIIAGALVLVTGNFILMLNWLGG